MFLNFLPNEILFAILSKIDSVFDLLILRSLSPNLKDIVDCFIQSESSFVAILISFVQFINYRFMHFSKKIIKRRLLGQNKSIFSKDAKQQTTLVLVWHRNRPPIVIKGNMMTGEECWLRQFAYSIHCEFDQESRRLLFINSSFTKDAQLIYSKSQFIKQSVIGQNHLAHCNVLLPKNLFLFFNGSQNQHYEYLLFDLDRKFNLRIIGKSYLRVTQLFLKGNLMEIEIASLVFEKVFIFKVYYDSLNNFIQSHCAKKSKNKFNNHGSLLLCLHKLDEKHYLANSCPIAIDKMTSNFKVKSDWENHVQVSILNETECEKVKQSLNK